MNRDREPLRATPAGWKQPAVLPAMSNEIDQHDRYQVTSRWMLVDGVPSIPVAAELHFSRTPRERWDERLRLLRAAGATEVSTYIYWNHHEEDRGQLRFDGNRDLAAFIRLAGEIGLGVILRVGPWSHGEARYGGFPDWVQHSGATLRTDDPRYLDLVEGWFGVLGEVAGPYCGPRGTVVAIQIENELVDRPHHIHTLKRMLRAAGLSAPLWTSSAWGSAQLPGQEVIPLYGGYPDGFWMEHDAPWDDSFRAHFFFSSHWDDTMLGADVRAQQGTHSVTDGAAPTSALFPIVTCELGGGMAGSYHRRPWPSALDVAAISNNALGSGSGWQGYYMFAGGTNPAGADGLQESHATGYPNDLPRFDYDFHAPIGASGRIAPSLGPLRRQHAALAAFGTALAQMPPSFPEIVPSGVEDATTLRWALRSDGASGFVFIGWHQPEVPLDDYRGAQFEIRLRDETVSFPPVPVDIPAGTVTRWPVHLEVGGVRVRWATASPLTVLDGQRSTLVLTADHGIDPQLASTDGEVLRAADGRPLDDGSGFVVDVARDEASIDVLVLNAECADDAWVIDRPDVAPWSSPASHRERQLLLSKAPLWTEADGGLRLRASETPAVQRYEPALRTFVSVPVELAGPPPRIGTVEARLDRKPDLEYRTYGFRDRRASAPRNEDFLAGSAEWTLRLPSWFGEYGDLVELEVDWTGDAAQLWLDGSPVADRFWDGSLWSFDLSAVPVRPDSELVLRVLPLFPAAPVYLPAGARSRKNDATAPLCSVDGIQLIASTVWSEQAR
ncbi:beta-galactosidase [Kribbella solani]|uniref:beta-galactosidase n=1 Tax=Kribbella solani TaxID=236067 RepID=UPI0029A70EBE|nr:beta-galactosidase [Kribbella solani]MDX2971438.1 beta-galactosidase [Kribbella solani]